MRIVKLLLPPPFDTVITKLVGVISSVGVPLITPVTGSKLNPAGKLGLTVKVPVPPVKDGMIIGISVPTVKIFGGLVGYVRSAGDTSFTVIGSTNVIDPPLFVAVMV